MIPQEKKSTLKIYIFICMYVYAKIVRTYVLNKLVRIYLFSDIVSETTLFGKFVLHKLSC